MVLLKLQRRSNPRQPFDRRPTLPISIVPLVGSRNVPVVASMRVYGFLFTPPGGFWSSSLGYLKRFPNTLCQQLGSSDREGGDYVETAHRMRSFASPASHYHESYEPSCQFRHTASALGNYTVHLERSTVSVLGFSSSSAPRVPEFTSSQIS